MSTYTPEELAEGWEFKILRSVTSRFKNPEFLRRCLEEEAPAGWTLIEKFDDNRVRLKRPAAARQRDSMLQIDPYRTSVGMSEVAFALAIIGSAIGSVIVIGAIVALVTRR